jgi:hypothetical protein
MEAKIDQVFRTIAEFAADEGIELVVLSGLDPIDGTLGRDVDAYVSDRNDALRIICLFREVLLDNGFRWVAIPNPIWGYRCVGIDESTFQYIELHLKTRLTVAYLDARFVFREILLRGHYGLLFDPGKMLFKFALMKKRKLLNSDESLWTSEDEIKLRHFISANLSSDVLIPKANRQKFLETLLEENGHATSQKRVAMYRRLFFRQLVLHPLVSVLECGRWISRKILVYESPCMPVFVTGSTINHEALGRFLRDQIGHVFLGKVFVLKKRLRWDRERMIRARQGLIVYGRSSKMKRRRGDTVIEMACDESPVSYRLVCEQILEEFCKFNNERWMSLCDRR